MSFDQMMIKFSAPTLCNIKSGNMFFARNNTFSQTSFDTWKASLNKYGIAAFSHLLSENSTAILVLNICWIRKILDDRFVNAYLSEKGYEVSNAFDFVNDLFNRMKNEQGFPHEIGVILGYPIEDVIEFEKHKGKNCKYCGCWKSYSDVENAKACKCNFTECSNLCKTWYDAGYSLDRIIDEYKRYSKAA